MSGIFVDGHLVHYETFGRGPALVFVHGWLGSWRYWVPVMEDFSGEYRTYALDLWGFGDSDHRQEQYEVDNYVELMLALMDELGIDRAPIVGHTLGAAVATRLATSYPERVSKVLATCLPLTAEAINHKLLAAETNDALAPLFWHRQRPYPEVETGLDKMAHNIVALTIQAVAKLDLRDTLYAVNAPLLAVYGGKDNVISPDQAKEMEYQLYAARSIVLANSRHFPMLDETAKFGRLLRDFLDIETPSELEELRIKKEWRRRTR
ncbi:MAG: alpha/beta fold hydrolase [Anaerolineae bacterium]|jgi:pimeloyl-ACP methyl ester carboxylesterase